MKIVESGIEASEMDLIRAGGHVCACGCAGDFPTVSSEMLSVEAKIELCYCGCIPGQYHEGNSKSAFDYLM